MENDLSLTVISRTDHEAAAPILNNVLFKLRDAVDELTKLGPPKTLAPR
jgi:hypothetical protein